MGIHGLSKLLGDYAPSSIKEHEYKSYFASLGRKIAIDASMSLYQFLIAVRQDGQVLMTESGETTSHLMGFFYRTIRMVDNGIKPVYVFDGKPPTMKSGELAKRADRRAEAQKELLKAEEQGDIQEVEKFQKRLVSHVYDSKRWGWMFLVKVTPEHVSEAKKLLSLMGIPYVEAPCEAEAQCAALTKAGKVYATATEDMDALTFGSSILVRNLTASEARKLPVREINLSKALTELDMDQSQFIDLCILLGCDYCDSIKGIGPVNAMKLLRQHGNIEKILKGLSGKKYQIPENWPFEEARRLFVEPDVSPADDIELKWGNPDEEGIVKFLVEEKGFSEDRIRNGVKKLLKSKQGSTQGRLDSFFKAAPSPKAGIKRKASDSKGPLKKKVNKSK